MTHVNGTYETENASKYLQQLCKHFGHKVDVDYDQTAGRVAFPFGTAHISATPQDLRVSCEIADEAVIEQFHHVIDSHLAKFAFRENFESMAWS